MPLEQPVINITDCGAMVISPGDLTGRYERGRAVGTTKWKNSFGCGCASSSHRVGGITVLQDVFHAPLDRGLDLRMGENVEALVAHRLVHLLRHVGGTEFPRLHRLFQAG